MTSLIDDQPVSLASQSRVGYLPYLDGLRGLAILMVLWYHADGPLFKGGFIGVDIFFVLSGYLITSLLIKEWDRNGNIHLGHFYMRRALRLLPAVFVFLIVYVSACWFVAKDFTAVIQNALIVLFYFANWARAMGRSLFGLGHTWSLSIEEQFYLLWPLLFVVVIRWPRRFLGAGLMLFAVALAGLRVVMLRHGASLERLYNGLDTHADPLLVGCALAFFLTASAARPAPAPVSNPILGSGAMLLLLAISLFTRLEFRSMYVAGFFVVAIAAAIVVWDLQARPGSILRAVTEWPPLVRLGRISYGVYLWHFPIYKELIDLRTRLGWHVRWPLYLIVGGGLGIGLAMLSYHFIEMPFLKLKRRFQ